MGLFRHLLILLLITKYCQMSPTRESATHNLCETCVTFGGKGRKREKKDQKSGRAGDDRRVIRNIYGVYGYYMSGTYPPPFDGKGRAGRYPSKKLMMRLQKYQTLYLSS